jgi:predicted secreted protein
MLVIDQKQNNGVVEVPAEDSFRLELHENPTTGYQWHLPSPIDPALRILDDSFERSDGGYGSGGIRRWTFVAERPSVIALEIGLRRSWEPLPVQTFKITVDVKPR